MTSIVFTAVGVEPRALNMTGKHPSTELYPQPQVTLNIVFWKIAVGIQSFPMHNYSHLKKKYNKSLRGKQ